MINKLKRCYECKQEKPMSEFNADKSRKDGLSGWCKECKDKYQKTYYLLNKEKISNYSRKYNKTWYLKNREKQREIFKSNYEKNKETYKIRNKKTYFRRYGISYEDAMNMWKKQNKLCAICKIELLPLGTQRTKGFCVDHDHKTGQFRGILCHNCNSGIGMFKENIEIIKKAVKYLNFIKETQNLI